MIPSGRTVQILAEVQEHIYIFIKVGKIIIAHMFQVQFFDQVLKVIIIQHALQEWIYQTSGY